MPQNEQSTDSGNQNDTHGKYTDEYIKILNTYNNELVESLKQKRDLKDKFYTLISKIMKNFLCIFAICSIGSIVILIVMICTKNTSASIIAGAITSMVTTFSTMLVSILKLPEIIAKYLFDKKEFKQMNDIIVNIQSYEIDAVKTDQSASLSATETRGGETDTPIPPTNEIQEPTDRGASPNETQGA